MLQTPHLFSGSIADNIRIGKLDATQAEIEALPNGSELLSIYPENDIETYRDVLYFTAQVLGGFFCINRAGKLEFRQYGETPVIEILREAPIFQQFL